MSEEKSRLERIEQLLQSIIGYLAKLRAGEEVAAEIKKLNKQVDLLLRRTETSMASMERLIALMEDFLRSRMAREAADHVKPMEAVTPPAEPIPPDATKAIREELEDIKQKISDLQFQRSSGFMDEEEFQRQLKPLEERRRELKAKLTELAGGT